MLTHASSPVDFKVSLTPRLAGVRQDECGLHNLAYMGKDRPVIRALIWDVGDLL